MNDLISRQDALDAITNMRDAARNNWGDARISGHVAAEIIRDLPSAQLEIITCKDCKWKNGTECMAFARVVPFPDDYCSRAVRKNE